jgi:acetyl esterase/lipase
MENPAVANMTRTELELVQRGYHVVAANPGAILGAPDPTRRWDNVYREMTGKYGLSKQVALMGVSREGLPMARWAAANPGKVSCLYMDRAVCDFKSWPGGKLGRGKGSTSDWASLLEAYHFKNEAEAMAFAENPVDLAPKLAADRIPIIYVAGEKDEVVPYTENGARMQEQYNRLGGRFKLILRKGEDHHPHGLPDPNDVVRFIQQSTYTVEPTLKAVSYGPHPKQILDFYRADSDKPTPLVFQIHGGGWTDGSHINVGLLEEYLKAGISVVSVEYRFIREATADGVVPPVKGPLYDAARALQFVRSKAREWNIRKDRIAATGGSAGACTSLWLAFHKDLADPDSADPIARESTRLYTAAVNVPQTSLDPRQMRDWTPNSTYGAHAFGIVGSPAEKKSSFAVFLEKRETILPWIAEYSPYAQASSQAPPIYMYFPEPPALGKEQKDPTHSANFGVKLQERLRELNVECELVYPGAPNVKHPSISQYLIDRLK